MSKDPVALCVTLTPEIDPQGETDQHFFDADPNEVVVITVRAAVGSPIEPEIQLFGPMGQVPLGGPLAKCTNICISDPLPDDGQYRIDVMDAGSDETGFYNITLEALSETLNGATTCAQPLGCGDLVSDTLDVVGESSTFRFDAATCAGTPCERVVLTLVSTEGIDAVLQLYDPDGNLVLGFCAATCTSPLLEEDGTYTVIVWDGGLNEAPGSYNLTLESISETLNGISDCQKQPLACGQTLVGPVDGTAIDVLGDSDAFSFAAATCGGTPCEAVQLTLRGSDGVSRIDPTIKLFDPDGARIPLDNDSGSGFCPGGAVASTCLSQPLPKDGIYTVILWDGGLDQVGDYDLGFEATSQTLNGLSNAPPNPACGEAVACGATLARTTDTPADSDSYTFDVNTCGVMPCEAVLFVLQGTDGIDPTNPTLRLFDPDGLRIPLDNDQGTFCPPASPGGGVCFSQALAKEGTHTVIVWDRGLDESGDYNLTMEAISASLDGASNGPASPVCGLAPDGATSTTCGNPVLANIDVLADSDAYTFDLGAGDVYEISATEVCGGQSLEPVFKLFGPDGSEIKLELNGLPVPGYCMGSDTNPCVTEEPLPSNGIYTVVVVDGLTNGTGFYRVELDGKTQGFRCEIPPCGSPGEDLDGDGVCADEDNCTAVANLEQEDFDGDGFGNVCDADFNNDCIVGVPDFGIFGAHFGGVVCDVDFAPTCDLNTDGVVGVPDFAAFGALFGKEPGPSGIASCQE